MYLVVLENMDYYPESIKYMYKYLMECYSRIQEGHYSNAGRDI